MRKENEKGKGQGEEGEGEETWRRRRRRRRKRGNGGRSVCGAKDDSPDDGVVAGMICSRHILLPSITV